ncbi:trans-1,2-dihydrobenzene-1,2-diol dehydrogenase-like [Ornithodoros turicata]|uniref:trans-1,2-dihydrobenzene-1,2-diol dehydrogenase-like n=1 Tax=Ornithodoros turicata TaxID=34597 RepID=UPI00313949EF
MATRWGIAGAGKIAHDFVSTLRSMQHHEVVAVADEYFPQNAKDLSKLHNIPTIHTTYDELASDVNIDVVYVAVIQPYHHTVGKVVLNRGKPMLMEKPFTLNPQFTRELIELAAQKKCFMMEAMWTRFLPAYRKMADCISSGQVGEVKYVCANFGLALEPDCRNKKLAVGGGAVLEFGIYLCNVCSIAFGSERPTKVVAVGHLNAEGVDETTCVVLQYSNGRLANLTASTETALPCNVMVVGTKGKIEIPSMMWCSPKVITPDGVTHEFPFPETVLPCNYDNSSGLRYEAEEVSRCLKEGLLQSPIMPHSETQLLSDMMYGIREQIGVFYPQES